MGIRKLYKNILVFSLTLIPLSGFCQGQTNSSDIFTKLLIGFVFAVVLGALYAIINLNKTLLDLQLERAGITKKKTTKSLWTKWKENLTDIVPVEKESNILLDHNYDGIEELDNSLPPWWLYGFYFSIIFSFFYIGYYHYYDYGLDSTQAYENEVLQAEIAVNAYLEKQANTIDESNLVALVDEKSLARGRVVFNNNCITCHLKSGGGAPNSVGPNLTDEYWLHGGDIKDVFRTIKYGVPAKGMIAWKAQLKPSDMHKVASYIMSLQGTNPPNAKAPQGDKFIPTEDDPQ